MLGKFCPAMRSLLPNLLGKKLMNIHSLIRVRAREIRSILHISYNYLSVRKYSNCKFHWELIKINTLEKYLQETKQKNNSMRI